MTDGKIGDGFDSRQHLLTCVDVCQGNKLMLMNPPILL